MGKSDSFVPIGILKEGTKQNEYISIADVSSSLIPTCTYPLGEAAHLTGYMGKLNDEELKKLQNKGYKADDSIGKAGENINLTINGTLQEKIPNERGSRVEYSN
ncbi:hypothetical protein BK708_21360 [Bacillus thuringiensis serovar yunnanensis]|nr:hypothetical protein BK708_21360 [Bacillus thuringiensis serovar yunnanensis]